MLNSIIGGIKDTMDGIESTINGVVGVAAPAASPEVTVAEPTVGQLSTPSGEHTVTVDADPTAEQCRLEAPEAVPVADAPSEPEDGNGVTAEQNAAMGALFQSFMDYQNALWEDEGLGDFPTPFEPFSLVGVPSFRGFEESFQRMDAHFQKMHQRQEDFHEKFLAVEKLSEKLRADAAEEANRTGQAVERTFKVDLAGHGPTDVIYRVSPSQQNAAEAATA